MTTNEHLRLCVLENVSKKFSFVHWLVSSIRANMQVDSVNSTTFIKRPIPLIFTDECLLYTKEILHGRLFIGGYNERRYVDQLQQYRDVIVISTEETELYEDIQKVKRKWASDEKIKWIGITGPEKFEGKKVYLFWVKLSNLPFGNYWFQIKHVKLLDEEVILKLKCIRKCPGSNLQTTFSKNETSDNRSILPDANTNVHENTYLGVFESTIKFGKLIQSTFTNAAGTIQPSINWRNFLNVIRITLAVLFSITISLATGIKLSFEYLLKLIRELTNFIHAITPIVIQVIDLISKLFGGILILIAAALGRNRVTHIQPYKNPPSIEYEQRPLNVGWRKINRMNIVQPYKDLPSIENAPPPTDWRKRNRILREELWPVN